MFFEVLNRTYHSPITIESLTYRLFRKRTAENYRRRYSLRSATLGSTAAALRAGK